MSRMTSLRMDSPGNAVQSSVRRSGWKMDLGLSRVGLWYTCSERTDEARRSV
jgi:hypothetical protein